jgi:hypothetical protein
MILAYFTPEVVLPVASILAAAMGFIMMVGRTPFRFVTRSLRTSVKSLKKVLEKSRT